MRYNSIFQCDSGSMRLETVYQKGINLPFRMHLKERVFKIYIITDLELLENGAILYHVVEDTIYGPNKLKPEDLGFNLVTKRKYDVTLTATPYRELISEETFSENLITNNN